MTEELKTSPRGKRKKTLEENVAENTRHIEENTKELKNESKMVHVLYGIVILLLLIIAGLAYFVGTKTSHTNPDGSVSAKDIKVTIISDERCSDCYTDELTQSIEALPFLSGSTFISLDFTESAAKKYMEQNGIELLPAVILNTNQIADGGNITPYLQALPDGDYTLNIGASFNPYAEICDNNIDDNSDGKIDCEDTSCSASSMCRVEEVGKLDVFLMGYCPYGEIAAKAIPELQKTFTEGLNIDFHYIATKTGDGYASTDFQSLHGDTEVQEDMRQLCIKKYYGTGTLIDYMQTRYANANNYGQVSDDVQLAYDAANIDAAKITACSTSDEGGQLLAEDIQVAEGLGIGASPTWLANNRYQFGGIDAATIQQEFCSRNPDIKGCENKIVANVNTSSQNPSCN